MNRRPQFLLNAAMATTTAILISCSGGAGGGGTATSTPPPPPPPPAMAASLSVTPNPIAEYRMTEETNVGLQVSMSVDKWPSGTTLYFKVDSSANGVGNIHYLSASSGTTGATVYLSLTFRNPWAIGEGTYSDSLVVHVSADSAGQNQILNSPQVIPITYKVAGPSVLGISPNAVTAGGSDFTLTITGMNFSPTSSILWNMSALPTTFVSPTSLTAQVPAAQIASAGSANVSISRTVVGSGSLFSNIFVLPVQTVASSHGSLSPSSAVAGGPGFRISVSGTDFQPTSYLQWNTDFLTTTYVSSTMLTAQVPAGEIASVGSAPLYVVNPWGTTNWFQFPILAPGSVKFGALSNGIVSQDSRNSTLTGGVDNHITTNFSLVNQ